MFNTNEIIGVGFYFWAGANWESLQESGPSSSGGVWSLTGNTVSGTEYIGTNSDFPLKIYTNGAHRFSFTSSGQMVPVNSNSSIMIGNNSNASASSSIALGNSASSSDVSGISLGASANASGANSLSLGMSSGSSGESAIGIGNAATAYGTNGIALGKASGAAGGSVGVGGNANAYGVNSVVVGNGGGAGVSAVAIGNATNAYGTNSVALGNGASSANNQIRLGNASITSITGQVEYTIASDARFKYNISNDVPGLAFIMRLNPVQYQFDREKYSVYIQQKEVSKNTGQIETGFLAQEVEKAANEIRFDFNGINKPGTLKDTYTLAYSTFVVPLVKAVQERQEQIEKQQLQIDELKAMLMKIMAKKI